MRAKLDKFIAKIKAKKQASFYSNKDQLRAVVASAISNAISTDMVESAGWVRLVDIDKSMNVQLPNKFILFISGATGVGKSTVARRLIHKVPRFIVLEESDLIRESIRATLNECIDRLLTYLNRKNSKSAHKYNRLELEKLLEWQIVNSSSKDLNSRSIKKQYQWLVPAMKQKCSRLNRLRVPAIIEGIEVSFDEMFNDDYFKSLGNSNNALFVNLVLSDVDEHKRRLRERSEERGESEAFTGNKKYDPIRAMGITLRDQTDSLSMRYKNVINIDASCSKDTTVHRIIEAIVRSVNPH
jgi:2-phosphoglycerate kinase